MNGVLSFIILNGINSLLSIYSIYNCYKEIKNQKLEKSTEINDNFKFHFLFIFFPLEPSNK